MHATEIALERITPVDATEVLVGHVLVDPDYVPDDGIALVLDVERVPSHSTVAILTTARRTTIKMAPRVYIGRAAHLHLTPDEVEGILADEEGAAMRALVGTLCD